MEIQTTADTSTPAIIMLAQIEVPILKVYEEGDQDPDPAPQPIDPGMTKY
jgi:hypothetical protein